MNTLQMPFRHGIGDASLTVVSRQVQATGLLTEMILSRNYTQEGVEYHPAGSRPVLLLRMRF